MRTVISLLISLCASTTLAQTSLDPLQRESGPAGQTVFGFSVAYAPTGSEGFVRMEDGATRTFAGQTHTMSFEGFARTDLTARLSVMSRLTGLVDLHRESGGLASQGSATVWTYGFGAEVGASYRLEPSSQLDPRVEFGIGFPGIVTTGLSFDLIRDPVVLGASLGIARSLNDPNLDLLVAVGTTLVANDRISLDLGAGWHIPIMVVGPPTARLRVGSRYTLDEATGTDLNTNVTLLLGRSPSMSLKLEYTVRR